jgi:hypothetical protein
MMDRERTLKEWYKRIQLSHRAHNKAAAKFEQLSRYFGIIATAFATAVGTSVFATLEASPNLHLKILAGLLSIAAAVLVSLQTFLKSPELAQKHKVAAEEYGELRRRIEMLWANPPAEDVVEKVLTSIDREWREVRRRSPIIPQRIYDQVAAGSKKADQKRRNSNLDTCKNN